MLDEKLELESNLVFALYQRVLEGDYELEADSNGIYLTPVEVKGLNKTRGRRITYYTCGDLFDTPSNKEEFKRLMEIASE